MDIALTDIDPSTKSLRVTGDSVNLSVPVTGNAMTISVETGSNSPTNLTVTPETRHPVPDIASPGASEGKRLELRGVHGIGAPEVRITATPKPAERSILVEAAVRNNGSPHISIGYAIGDVECVPVNGAPTNHTFTNVARDKVHKVTVCATHTYDSKGGFGTTQVVKDVLLTIPAPNPATYTVGGDPVEQEPGTWVWDRVTTTANPSPGYVLEYAVGTQRAATLTEVFPAPGTSFAVPITIRNCDIDPDTLGPGTECGAEIILTPTGAHVSPIVTFEDRAGEDGICRVGDVEDFVTITGHESEVRIREVAEQGSGTVRIIVDFPSLGLTSVTSNPCTPAPEAEDEDGDDAEILDPSGAPGDTELLAPTDSVTGETASHDIERNEE